MLVKFNKFAESTIFAILTYFLLSQTNMKLSITPSGKISALMSPTGRMYQYGSRVEAVGFGKRKVDNK